MNYAQIKIVLTIFYFLIFSITVFSSETSIYVELESIKNNVKINGYSSEIHNQLTDLYESNKSQLPSFSSGLAEELKGLVRSSILVQGLKECVDTGHEDINNGIDNLFTGIVKNGCLNNYFNDPKVTEIINETDNILETIKRDNATPIEQIRKTLFERTLPDLKSSFANARNQFSDVDERFKKSDDELFSLLPPEMRSISLNQNTSALTYEKASEEILGPINELYENVYGDRSDLALSDEWMSTYVQNDDSNTPHLFSPPTHERNLESAEMQIERCLSRLEEVHALQAQAQDHFNNLSGMTHSMGLSGFVRTPPEHSEPFQELGFATPAQCTSMPIGIGGRHNMDRFVQIESDYLENGVDETIAIEGKTVVMTLGELGSDPNGVYNPNGSENLETRSFLGTYTESSIRESHEKALEGMVSFINHMGRRVYGTSSNGLGQQLLDGAGDVANTLTSLGDSKEVDVALLLMANPNQGMKMLIENPQISQTFCDSFKALRNQNNVNQALEIASMLSMFTGVGGMFVKGATTAAKGLRVANIALAGADTLSIADSMTHARDLALANACQGGNDNLCQEYLNSDRNMNMAIAGLMLASGGAAVNSLSRVTRRIRSSLTLRNGEKVQGIISDNHKLSNLMNEASESQKQALAAILGHRNLNDGDVHVMLSILNNTENTKNLDFLEKFNSLDRTTQDELLSKMINRSDHLGGTCTLPS